MSVDVDLKGVLECDDKDNSMVFLFYDNSNEFWSSFLECQILYTLKKGVRLKENHWRFFLLVIGV